MNTPDSTPRSSSSLPPYTQESLKALIEKGRDDFDHDQMEALLVLYEQDNFEDTCRELGMEEGEVIELLAPILGVVTPEESAPLQDEKRNKSGLVRRRRLGSAALTQIIKERTDLEPEEIQILETAAISFNQVIAAHSLGITYKDFMAKYHAIRRKYDF